MTSIIPPEVSLTLENFPALEKLYQADNLGSYMAPLMQWKLNKTVFPNSARLIELIKHDTHRLYGQDTADNFAEHLQTGAYIAETGPHMHMPRDLDRLDFKTKGYQNINTLTLQSILATTAIHSRYQQKFKLSMFTGIIPGRNTQSASYLQTSTKNSDIPRLISNKWAQHIQAYLPAMDNTKIDDLSKTIGTMNHLIDKDRTIQVLNLFKKNNTSFSDQISSGCNYLFDELQSESNVKQITLDSHLIAATYFTDLLADKNSLISAIFKDQSSADHFSQTFAGIRTGWKEGETPFINLEGTPHGNGQAVYKTSGAYTGPCDRDSLLIALNNKTIMPTGVMGFFATMVEGGLLSTGGMFQSEYCTQIRDRAVPLLKAYGDPQRAEILSQMPTDIATVSPVWGIDQTDDPDLLNYSALLTRVPPLSKDIFAQISDVTGPSALYGAVPTLLSLTGNNLDLANWQKNLPHYNLLRV